MGELWVNVFQKYFSIIAIPLFQLKKQRQSFKA